MVAASSRPGRTMRVLFTTSTASGARGSLDELPGSRAPDELTILDHYTPARDDGIGGAGHPAAFVRVVIDLHVERASRERHHAIRIEDDDVAVRTGRDRSLAGKQPEDLRRRSRRQLDEAVQRDAPGAHAAVVHQAHARLDARRSVRYLREIVPSQLLLLF